MRLFFMGVFFLACSCASLPKREIDFQPSSINTPDKERVYACYQDGKTEKFLCVDINQFLNAVIQHQARAKGSNDIEL